MEVEDPDLNLAWPITSPVSLCAFSSPIASLNFNFFTLTVSATSQGCSKARIYCLRQSLWKKYLVRKLSYYEV